MSDGFPKHKTHRIEETVMVKRSTAKIGNRAMFGEYVGNKLITYNIQGLNKAK